MIKTFDMNTYSHLLPSIKPKSYIEEQMKKLRDGGIPDGLRTGIDSLDDMVAIDELVMELLEKN